jgi:exonuclease SbcC
VAARAAHVARAARRSDTAAQCTQLRAARLREAQAQVDRAERLSAQLKLQRQSVQAIDSEAGQHALRQADLSRRFGLTAQVPCAGTDLQGRCQLLGDAHEAKALIPSVEGKLSELAERKRQLQEKIGQLDAELRGLNGAAERRNRGEYLVERAQARQSQYAVLAAQVGEVQQALNSLEAVRQELAALPEAAPAQTDEEAAERNDIAVAQERITNERERAAAALREAHTRIDAAPQGLPAALDHTHLTQARRALAEAQRMLREAESAEVAAVRAHEQSAALQRQLDEALAQKQGADARAARVERELVTWTLLAKCLSNDGVIALDIDDAGPTFSALANDLLLACYGPRFTLEVITQTSTAKGELREDFDIMVHDGLRGEAKSLKLVSGGERVWINECLTRAIALYLAGNTGRQYGTLFCDEADGPLDPEHKRMFMEMKREVRRLGGYAREFFVSQTPELTAMADRIIDLDGLARQEKEVA